MTPVLALALATRTDRDALAEAGRSHATRSLPAALTRLAAVATVTFGEDPTGGLRDVALHARNDLGGEGELACWTERRLADLFAAGGRLVTFGGRAMLLPVRLALIRARSLGGAGVARWVEDPGGRHLDLADACGGAAALRDVAAALGFGVPGASARHLVPPLSSGVGASAEVEACMLAMLHVHLEAERLGDATVLSRGMVALGRRIEEDAVGRPALAPLLGCPLLRRALRRSSAPDRAVPELRP